MDDEIFELTEQQKETIRKVCAGIWQYAEPGMKEICSAALLKETLSAAGFQIEDFVAGISTAFCASFGQGEPVIALTAEYDALPGLSQAAGIAERRPLEGNGYGHGCGHNQIAAGVVGAALALKVYMEKYFVKGTLRVYGCPAEETVGCKRIMAEQKYFDDVDCAFSWHPFWYTSVMKNRMAAAKSLEFQFHGVSSHGALSPDQGRSALDAAELMNIGCNYLREHIPADVRFQYAYQDAGEKAPNIIPDHAAVRYQLRGGTLAQIRKVADRIEATARGAAMMTDTTVERVDLEEIHEYIPNETLGNLLQDMLLKSGAPDFDEADFAFAGKIAKTFPDNINEDIHRTILSRYGDLLGEQLWKNHLFDKIDLNPPEAMVYGSSDVGDVSVHTPMAQIRVASTCLGTANHTWQVTAMGNTPIAYKACLTAAKVLAGAALEIYQNEELRKKAMQEWRERRIR